MLINMIKSGTNPNNTARIPNMAASVFKVILLVAMVLSVVFFSCMDVRAENSEVEQRILDEQSGSDETTNIKDQIAKRLSQETREIMPEFDPEKIISDVSRGSFDFSFSGLIQRVLRYLFKEFYLNVNILIKLIVLVILCSILKNLQSSFLSDSVGELAFYACYIVIVSILLVSFNASLNMGKDLIDNLVGFMHATIPAMITLLVSGGNVASGAVFQPILLMIVEISATIMKNFFIPLIFLYATLSVVNNISDKIQISKLALFLKQIGTWSLGLMLTVFVAIVTIQGSAGAVVDGVTGKAAKFAIGAFIPVAGKYLADAADTVVGCTLLIKNAAGIAVMLGIVSICLVPVLKIFAMVALYRVTCVLIEPIAEKRITGCINDIANSLTFVLGIVASVAFMFLITITAIITAGSITAAVR